MSKEIKILGITLRKGSAAPATKVSSTGEKRRARSIIKKQPKREVSYQIEDIKKALTLAKNVDTPDRNMILKIYDYIRKDAHLKSQIRTAKFKVQAEPYQVYVNKKVDLTLTDNLTKRWLNYIIEFILDAELYGFTLVEVDKIDSANWSIQEVVSFDREHVSIEKQWILIEGNINGSYLPYTDIMNEMDLLEFGRRDDLGILLECAYNVIWKFYSRSDWSRGSEKFGMPMLVIKANTNNDDELDRLEKQAANFGADGYIVTQAGDEADIKERTGQRMHDIWLDNIKLCNEEMSKNINGSTASSDPKAFVGAAEVQERTMEDFTYGRLQNIVDEVNEKVFPYLISKGFSIPEGAKFDYPVLIRERERRLNGPMPIEPKDKSEKEEKDNPKKDK